MEEDEGTTTNVEGRVIHHRKVVNPPGEAREDWKIICELATRLGHGDKFNYSSPRDIFEELRVASKGGVVGLLRHHLGSHRREQWNLLAMP